MFAQSALAVLLALPLFAQSAVAAECTRTYQVQAGDICDSISAAKNVSTYQLAAVNVGKIDSTCSNLQPGETICLGNQDEDCTETYVVQPDDTCDGVCEKSGINSTLLYTNNPQIDQQCDNLYIGEVICVAKQVQVPSAPAGSRPAVHVPAGSPLAVPYCDEL